MQFLSPFVRIVPVLLCCLAWAGSAAGYAFSGVAVDAEEAPVPGATVWLSQEGGVSVSKTDAKGRFAFPSIAAGPTIAAVYKEGYAVGGFAGQVLGDFETPILLPPPAKLTLKVVNQKLEPLPGARIRAMLVNGRLPLPVEELVAQGFPRLRSNDEGIIEIPWLPEGGLVNIVLSHVDYAELRAPFLPVRERQNVVQMREGGLLAGRVTHGGEPVEGARVAVFHTMKDAVIENAERRTNSDGYFSVRLIPGDYHVAVRHEDYALESPAPVQVRTGGDTAVQLEVVEQHTITGRVENDGQGAGGAEVYFRSGGVVHDAALTDSAGRYQLRMAPSQGVVGVNPPPGFMVQGQRFVPVDMGDKFEAALNPIEIIALPVIRGKVVDQDGAPVRQAVVSTIDMPLPLVALSKEDGSFTINLSHSPEEPELALRAEHPLRFQRKDFTVNLRKAEPATVRLETFGPDAALRPPEAARNNIAPLVGEPAPALDASEWYNGEPVTLEALEGKVVVLVFWSGFDTSPYGAAMLQAAEVLNTVFAEEGDVAIVGVHEASSLPEDVQLYIKTYGLTFPICRDTEEYGSFAAYNIGIIPQVVMIGRDGKVRYYQVDGRLLELVKVLRREAG